MRQGFWLFCLLLVACQAKLPAEQLPAVGAPPSAQLLSDRRPDYQLSAGQATVFDQSREAYSHRFPDMDETHRTAFFSGESLFDQNWVTAPSSTVARDGLGPLFNARGCAACHVKDGRGQPFDAQGQPLEAVLVRLSQPGQDPHAGPLPDPQYGGQLQPFALQGLRPEGQLHVSWRQLTGQYADGVSYQLQAPEYQLQQPAYGGFSKELQFSVRQTPVLVGLGLLEQIPEPQLQALEDPDDHNQDGISGRTNQVWSLTQARAVRGRFGWKANQPDLQQQVAAAFAGDIGITTSLFPHSDVSAAQEAGFATLPTGGEPELDDRLLERVVFYVQNLAVPAQRHVSAAERQAGQLLFRRLNCQACHHEQFDVKGQKIYPYTDLLLHDLGPELADQRPDYLASGQEWRTAPLWGLGLLEKVNGHQRLLHDGRARSFEEAILWHGGEAEPAREAFKALTAVERQQLIKFLKAL